MNQAGNSAYLARMRWRCRRGLLELDIVLEHFMEHYSKLDARQRLVFDELLELPDNTLWDMISGKTEVVVDEQQELLKLINSAL
ncbi:MAG: succinate dehydrogenase assembly factor 2 [Gallionellaceae bacterium]|jgi:antitoxin CptB